MPDFNNEEIRKIISLGESFNPLPAKSGNDRIDASIRDMKISWVPFFDKSEWLFKKSADIIGTSLRLALNPYQYSVYKTGGHYTWHRDMFDTMPEEMMPTNFISCVVQLSDPSEYEGGDLEIKTKEGIETVVKQRGLATPFPCTFLHRVTTVTSGIRKTLIMWGVKP
jgi:PKHD-type hydroxylase